MGANGNLQKGYTYDEFGSIEESGNVSFLNEVTFTGSVTDTSTGLQYMNSRYYDSSTGRFLAQDSYSGSPYDPWTQHLYSYCGNNPVNMVDPTGHFCISAIIIGVVLAAMGAFKFKGTRPYILILHYDESASGQIKQMVKQLPSPRLKSKTVQRDGIEMTLELRLKDNETGFVEKFMRVEGVYDAALISHQGDIVS